MTASEVAVFRCDAEKVRRLLDMLGRMEPVSRFVANRAQAAKQLVDDAEKHYMLAAAELFGDDEDDTGEFPRPVG